MPADVVCISKMAEKSSFLCQSSLARMKLFQQKIIILKKIKVITKQEMKFGWDFNFQSWMHLIRKQFNLILNLPLLCWTYQIAKTLFISLKYNGVFHEILKIQYFHEVESFYYRINLILEYSQYQFSRKSSKFSQRP